jgi:hypothetical protein
VVNSAHLASLASPDAERWLPIFWALDNFKNAQAQTEKESGWRMKPVDESKVPPGRKARAAFLAAMEAWDEEAADATVAGLARTAGSQEVFELFSRLGARDFRDIGHKAIFVANSWRTLQCIGWQHAEPILRSLAYALLQCDGKNPAQSDEPADRPGRLNKERLTRIKPGWEGGKPSKEATTDMLGALRQGVHEACDNVVELLNRGVAPQSIWDALQLGAGELLMRQPGIVGLHAVTSTNALRYAYETSGVPETRLFLMLQNAAFLPLFHGAMQGRGAVADLRIDQLEAGPLQARGPAAVREIFNDVGKDKMAAAQKVLAYLKDNPDPKELMDRARLLVFFKGSDSHDYKFSSAVLEDYFHVSPGWRDRYLASSMVQLRGSTLPDTDLVKRTRAALKG